MIQVAQTDDELQRCCTVLAQLRSVIAEPALLTRIKSQMLSGYRVAYAEAEGGVVSVAGFRLGENLAWGKHLYIDDLVSDGSLRSRRHGATLFQWLLAHAKANHCSEIHLDSGVQRFAAHKFYFREGLKISSYHFSMRLESDVLEAP